MGEIGQALVAGRGPFKARDPERDQGTVCQCAAELGKADGGQQHYGQ